MFAERGGLVCEKANAERKSQLKIEIKYVKHSIT